jgi:hypothetical protein
MAAQINEPSLVKTTLATAGILVGLSVAAAALPDLPVNQQNGPTTAVNSTQATPPKIKADQIDQALEEGAFFLDVRSAQEIQELGTLAGYTHIPIEELEKRLSELPQDRPILTA